MIHFQLSGRTMDFAKFKEDIISDKIDINTFISELDNGLCIDDYEMFFMILCENNKLEYIKVLDENKFKYNINHDII